MTLRPVWLAVASIVALGLLVIFALCRAAARADRASELAATRCPQCGHDFIGADYCGAPLVDTAAGPQVCACVYIWHRPDGGQPVVQPTPEELDRLWQRIEAALREERGDR